MFGVLTTVKSIKNQKTLLKILYGMVIVWVNFLFFPVTFLWKRGFFKVLYKTAKYIKFYIKTYKDYIFY